MKRVLSGIQPSGSLHLGNYFGMMSRMIEYQKKNDLFCFIVNYHALTTIKNKDLLAQNTMNAALDFLALGLDPDRSTFWVQSDVPQVCESTWLFSNISNISALERATAFKDKVEKGFYPNVGLFSYPLLMASDILLFGGQIIPTGKDQKQNLEITRDIALKFNKIFGDVFIVPQPDISSSSQLIPGLDGKKMSKSYDNTIPIFGSEKNIRKRFMSIVTDSADIDKPKSIDTPLYDLYCLFLNDAKKEELAERFKTPGMRYGDIKQELFECFWTLFQPYREKREYLSNNKDYVLQKLNEGAEKASLVADIYLKKAREAMGLNYG